MQVPTVTKVTVAPDTVQTGVVVDVNTAAKADDAVAATVNGATPKLLPVSATKVMVCAPFAIANDWLTCVAAVKLVLPV